jgi:hypothetical protein
MNQTTGRRAFLPGGLGVAAAAGGTAGRPQTPIDLKKLRGIIGKTGYRGFSPIEALAPGAPGAGVTAFLNQVRKAFL